MSDKPYLSEGELVSYFVKTVESEFARTLLGKRGTVMEDAWNREDRVEVEFENGETHRIRARFLRPVQKTKKEGTVGSILNKMSVILRKTLNKDDRVLVRQGILNTDLSVRDVDFIVQVLMSDSAFRKQVANAARELAKEEDEDSSEE